MSIFLAAILFYTFYIGQLLWGIVIDVLILRLYFLMGGDSGIVLPIVSEVTPALSGAEGRIIATGKLKTIAKEAVLNVSAVIKNMQK